MLNTNFVADPFLILIKWYFAKAFHEWSSLFPWLMSFCFIFRSSESEWSQNENLWRIARGVIEAFLFLTPPSPPWTTPTTPLCLTTHLCHQHHMKLTSSLSSLCHRCFWTVWVYSVSSGTCWQSSSWVDPRWRDQPTASSLVWQHMTASWSWAGIKYLLFDSGQQPCPAGLLCNTLGV